MIKLITSSLVVATLALNGFAYDTSKAEQFNKFYKNFTQKACADSKLFIKAEETMKMLREKKNFVLLDVRTIGEHEVLSAGTKNSIYIPLKDLFKKKNLDKLPTDKTIIVMCHSGTRATLAAIGLKQIGIKNTRVLKGGMVALAEANNPKNAPLR